MCKVPETAVTDACAVADVGIKKKAYRRRCEDQIGMCIQDSFAPLLQTCSSLAAAGADTNKKTNEILTQVLRVRTLSACVEHVRRKPLCLRSMRRCVTSSRPSVSCR